MATKEQDIKRMTAAERRSEGVRYAGPGDSFPIRPSHPEDVRNAWNLAGHADEPDKVRSKIRAIAKELGMESALPETAKEGGKSVRGAVGSAGETWVTGCRTGSEVKYLGDGKIGGACIVFSGADDPDLVGDFFDAETDLWLDEDAPTKATILFDHGLDPDVGSLKLGRGRIEKRDTHAWAEAKLNEREEYVKGVLQLAESGALGWSTGSAGHLILRTPVGKSNHLDQWPIIEVSLTHRPAEPRTFALPLKSWAATKAVPYAADAIDSWKDGAAAQAAISTLTQFLLGCIGECFTADQDGIPRPERLARIRMEFAEFTDDSLAVIDALLDDESSPTKSFLLHRAATASIVASQPLSVVSALAGYRDLTRRLAGTRERDGRKLGTARLDELKSVVDGASPLIDDLRALLTAHVPLSPAAVATAEVRRRLLALKNRHATKARTG